MQSLSADTATLICEGHEEMESKQVSVCISGICT